MPRKALGRGLDALIPEKEEKAEKKPGGGGGGTETGETISSCPVNEIRPGKYQPRKQFDDRALEELASSIKNQGVLQPLLVRPRSSGGYELIAGERRWRAAKIAGLDKVPIIIKDADDRSALELSLIENIQRENLDPLEEGDAYKRLLAEFDYTQEQLSKRIGKDRTTIANLMRLLSLPEDIQEDVRAGKITAGHARAILMAGSESSMRSLRDQIVNEGLSVREAERRASGERKPKTSKKKSSAAADKSSSVHVRSMEEKLLRELGTKVKIQVSSKGGKIEIHFFSAEDLDRIYTKIVG